MIKLHLDSIEGLLMDFESIGELIESQLITDTSFLGLCILKNYKGEGIAYLVDCISCLLIAVSSPDSSLLGISNIWGSDCIIGWYTSGWPNYIDLNNMINVEYKKVEELDSGELSWFTFLWSSERGDYLEVWSAYITSVKCSYLLLANLNQVKRDLSKLKHESDLKYVEDLYERIQEEVHELESNYPIEILN